MTYGVQLPDGRTIGFDESTPLETAQQIVRRDFPEAFQKKSGVGAEFKEGLASLIGGTKTALTAPFDAKEAAKRGLLEEQARGAEFESAASLDKLKKAYADYGLLGGASELTRQAPAVVAGMAPQTLATLGATATGARLGAVAGLPGIIGGAGAGFLSSFLPQSGQNITRQAEVQQAAGQEINPNLAAAYGAGAGQAALETASLGFGLGKRLVSKVLGESEEQIAKGLARNAAKYEADLVKAAEAKLIPTVAKGAARGLVEIPTEVAQQILERAQAGLELFSPDALKEYGESAYQASIGGSLLGGAAGPISRASARGDLDTLRAQQRATQRKEELAKEQEYKASPEYVAELTGRRDKLQEEMSLLEPIIKGKPTTDEEKQLKREAGARMRDYKIEMQDIVSQLREAAPETKGLPETLDQRLWRERIAKQTAPIAQERGMVTDEFGNIVPGLTKEAAVAGRELTLKEKATADRAMLDLKKLQEAEAKRQLNEQEKAHKAFLQQQIDEIRSTSDFAKQYVDAQLISREKREVINETGELTTATAPVSYKRNIGVPKKEDTTLEKTYYKGSEYVAEPGLIRQKGLEQVLRAKGQPVTPEERTKFEQNIDNGYLTRDLKGVLGLGADKELGQKAHDLKVLEDAQDALPVLQERMRAYRDQNREVLNKDLFDKSGEPTIDYRRSIAAQTVYAELNRLANIAKDTISKNKDAQIVSQGLAEAKRKLPKEVNLVDKNLAPEAYQKVIDEQLETQQRAYDDMRIALDDLAEGNVIGKDEMAGGTAETLKQRAEIAKQEYIDAALKQAAAYRLYKGSDALTEGEARDVAEKMDAELSDAIARGQLKPAEYEAVQSGKAKPIYEDVLVPAQMRAGKIVRPAYTSRKLVGFEGLEQFDLFKGIQGYEDRDAALGSVGLDFGPRLPANLVKQMRGAGVGAKATGAPSEKMTGFEAKALPGIVEHRGYVQDKLSSLKVGLMRVPQYTKEMGAGPKGKVTPEKKTLFLEKTKGEPVVNKEGKVVGYKETGVEKDKFEIEDVERAYDDALNLGRTLEKKKGLPRDVGRTLLRAVDFIANSMVVETVPSGEFKGEKGVSFTDYQISVAPKDVKNVVALVKEQVQRIKQGQDTTRRYVAETNNDLNELLDKYAAREESKQGDLFAQSKKMANRQLAEIKSELDELGPVSDFKDLRERFDLNRRMKETEEWIAKFHGPSGMGRAIQASAIKTKPNLSGRPEYSEYATAQWWKQESENLAEAIAAFEKEQSDFELRMNYVEMYKDTLNQLETLDSDYRYTNIPGFLLGKSVRTEEQEQRRSEYLTTRSKFTTLLKDILGILRSTNVRPTKEGNYAILIKDATAELEEVLKAKFAHHELILESLKTAPARYLHAYRMRKAAEAKLSEYNLRLKQLEAKEFVNLPATKNEREEVLAAQKEAEKLFKYSEGTLKSIKDALNKDTVVDAVNKDPDVIWAREQLDMLLKKVGKPLKPTQALTEEGKRLRDERAAAEKNAVEKVKAANNAMAQIAKLDKELSKTVVSQKPLEFIQKERAANAAVDADQTKVDALEAKIKELEAVKKPNAQQTKSLAKARKDLEKANEKLDLAKNAQLQLAAAAMKYVETTIAKPVGQLEEDKQEAFLLLVNNLENKRDQYQEAIYKLNKEKAAKGIVDAVEKQKQAINGMIERLKKRGPNTEGLPSLESIKDAEDFISTMRARAEIKGALEATKGTRMSLQELEDINKVLEEQAKIADKFKNPDRARELRAEIKENQSLIDAEKALVSKGNNPEKAVRKHALRTGHNSNYKTAQKLARGEIYASKEGSKKVKFTALGESLNPAEREAYIQKRTAAEFNRLSIAEAKFSNDSDFDDTVMRVTKGESGGIDIEQANAYMANVLSLPNPAKIKYVESIAKAPDEFLLAVSRKGLDPAEVRGGVMPDGTVVVIGNTHTSIGDLQETIAHETIGHYAIDSLLGPEGMKALVKKAFSAGKEGVYKLAAELGVYDDVAEAAVAGKTAGMSEDEINTLMVREMLAHVAERPLPSKLSQALKDFIKAVVAAVRKFFIGSRLDTPAELTTQEVFNLIREAKKQYENGTLGAYKSGNGDVVFRDDRRFGSSVSQNSIDTFNKLYAKKKTLMDNILANMTGMSGRIQWFDNLAGFEHILGEAEKKGQLTSEDALIANYFMRLHGQRLNLTSQFATHGVSQLAKNEAGELDLIERPDAANLVNVSKILEKAKKLGSPKVVNQFFQTYLVAKRVKRVGLKALNVELNIKEQDLKNVLSDVEAAGATGIFEEAAAEYASYNKALIDFAVKTGAIPKEEGARLTKYNDYVPFYRVKNGYAELVVAGEHAISIGRLKDQPYLHELVGGKEMLVDFETSAFQNTGILVDLAMRNMATTSLMRALEKVGGKDRIATRVSSKVAGDDIVRGKVDGYEAAWRLNTKDTGFEDIPAELLVKGLEGIKTTLPVAVKALGLPSRFLRTMITRTPTYVVNQIVKDSTAMWLYSGADIKPVLSATKELGSMLTGKNLTEKKLQASGIEGGQLFTGMPEDMGKIMLQIMGGKNTMQELFVKADRLAMKADAATRVAMYNSFVQKGMSPMRAKLAVLEALNFNKRGLSPTIHMLSTLVPFMNTQIQGLDVLAKAFRGKLTLGQQKDLRAKLWRRGTALGLFTIAYAALMSDDEAYKNADPWTKYTSWFIRVPFFDEPIKVPAPFEFGYVFKALPEAVYNMAFKDEKLSNVRKFYTQAAINSIPISVPQGIKPAIEAFTGTSFYTGQNIESAREKSMLPGFRERNNTTEVAKLVASIAPETLSPVMLDHLTRGYSGGLGIALASVLNPFLAPTSNVVAPEKTSSQLPLIGGFFQPNDAPGVINAAYEISNRAQQASKTFNDLVNSGQKEKATAFLNKFKNEIVMQEAAGSLVREMGELSAVERLITRGEVKLSAEEKTAKLKEIRAAKIKLADAFSKGYEKISERG
jgi:hypothetical protein